MDRTSEVVARVAEELKRSGLDSVFMLRTRPAGNGAAPNVVLIQDSMGECWPIHVPVLFGRWRGRASGWALDSRVLWPEVRADLDAATVAP